jgi:hypothetical protein
MERLPAGGRLALTHGVEMKLKVALVAVFLCSLASAQEIQYSYWTTSRKAETVGVTLLHMTDAAQTC